MGFHLQFYLCKLITSHNFGLLDSFAKQFYHMSVVTRAQLDQYLLDSFYSIRNKFRDICGFSCKLFFQIFYNLVFSQSPLSTFVNVDSIGPRKAKKYSLKIYLINYEQAKS
jgi:hypothetical protein